MTTSQRPPETFWRAVRRRICRWVCDDEPPQPPKDTPIAFMPGQICILAEYPPDPDRKLTKRQIVEEVRRNIAERQLSMQIDFAQARVAIIRGRDRTLANVVGWVPKLRDEPAELLGFIREVHKQIALPPLQGRRVDKGDVGQTGSGEYLQGGEQPAEAARPAGQRAPARGVNPPAERFNLRAASANWLMSGAKFIIGGGPGAQPVSVLVPSSGTTPAPWEFTMPAGLGAPGVGELTRPVEVVILDTVPRLSLLQAAHTDRVTNQVQPHPLLQRLLSSSSGAFNVVDRTLSTSSPGAVDQLEVWYNSSFPIASIFGQDYTMSSHGLFVAGIIRTIAPQVKLRMIQVLHDDATGELQDLMNAIETLSDREDDAPLLVNCSFLINVPLEGEDLQQLMEDIFALVSDSNVAVIAAAGNQGNAGLAAIPEAQAPASYADVTGVGALKRDNITPASYTNKADAPPTVGFAAFGGEVALGTDPPTTDLTNGVLGVFIDNLPDSLINETGWVRWAGTSFSTPIVTAALANVLSRTANTDDPLLAVNDLLGLMPSGTIGETVAVTQG